MVRPVGRPVAPEAPVLIGSLFAGIGGLDLACERAGLGRVVWQVEIDPFCRAVLAKHWPDAERFEDVRSVGSATLAPVDVICGGFPCQDVSLAGRGAGLAGARSGLWFEYLRIVAELRPCGVLVENVGGLARRGLDTVAGGLVDLGYAVEVSRVAASDVGAPHRRIRHFILAYADGPRGLQPRGQCGPDGASAPAACGGSPGVGDASRHRQQEPGCIGNGGGVAALVSAGPRVADPDGEGQPQQGGVVADERGRLVHGRELADAHRFGLEVSERGEERDEQPAAPGGVRHGGRAAESRLGRGVNGLPAGLDGPGPGGAWPAARGEAQAPWEPPRTRAGVVNRPARLRALGNAVCPQQGAVAALRLRALLEGPC